MKKIIFLICLLLLTKNLCAQTIEVRYSSLQQLARSLAISEKNDDEKSDAIEAGYKKFHDHEITFMSLMTNSKKDLELLFDANQEVAFISKLPRYALNMELIFTELKKQKLNTASQADSLFSIHIRMREFDKANKLITDGLVLKDKSLPNFKPAVDLQINQPSEWIISQHERLLVQRAVKFNETWQMIVVSHPNCHFSRNAMLDILANDAIKMRIKGRSKWITPQDANLNFDLFQRWNSMYPDAEISVVHRRKDWPLKNFSSTPIFYFLVNGKVVSSFSGWPKEGNYKQLTLALDELDKLNVISKEVSQ
jgi:hypothetical protein